MLTDGKQIAAARQLLGWSQADLADKSGVSKPSIIRIEKDLMSVKHDIQMHIKKAIEQNNVEFLDQNGVRENKQTLIKYSGQKGFRDFYNDLYETARDIGGDICLFNGVSDLVTKWLGDDYVEMHKSRMIKIKDNYNYRIIVEDGDKVFFGSNFCEYRWFPKEYFNDKTIYIFGEKVGFVNFQDKEIEVIAFNQSEFAECQKLFFDLAWNHLAIKVNE